MMEPDLRVMIDHDDTIPEREWFSVCVGNATRNKGEAEARAAIVRSALEASPVRAAEGTANDEAERALIEARDLLELHDCPTFCIDVLRSALSQHPATAEGDEITPEIRKAFGAALTAERTIEYNDRATPERVKELSAKRDNALRALIRVCRSVTPQQEGQ